MNLKARFSLIRFFRFFAILTSLNLNQLVIFYFRSIFWLVHSHIIWKSSDCFIWIIFFFLIQSNSFILSSNKIASHENEAVQYLTCINVSRDHQKLSLWLVEFHRSNKIYRDFRAKTKIFVASDFDVIFRIFVNREFWELRLSAGLRKRSNCSWFVVWFLWRCKKMSWFGATLGVI